MKIRDDFMVKKGWVIGNEVVLDQASSASPAELAMPRGYKRWTVWLRIEGGAVRLA